MDLVARPYQQLFIHLANYAVTIFLSLLYFFTPCIFKRFSFRSRLLILEINTLAVTAPQDATTYTKSLISALPFQNCTGSSKWLVRKAYSVRIYTHYSIYFSLLITVCIIAYFIEFVNSFLESFINILTVFANDYKTLISL